MNVWMGVTVEDEQVFHRVDDLLRQVPAHVRILSCEPLLGSLAGLNLEGIGWLIAGGESGPHYRLMDENWVRQLRDLCVDEEVPFVRERREVRSLRARGAPPRRSSAGGDRCRHGSRASRKGMPCSAVAGVLRSSPNFGVFLGPGPSEKSRADTKAPVRELARGLEPLTCCFSAGAIGPLWPAGMVCVWPCGIPH
jgi:Protein of unknown function (DUF5131)